MMSENARERLARIAANMQVCVTQHPITNELLNVSIGSPHSPAGAWHLPVRGADELRMVGLALGLAANRSQGLTIEQGILAATEASFVLATDLSWLTVQHDDWITPER